MTAMKRKRPSSETQQVQSYGEGTAALKRRVSARLSASAAPLNPERNSDIIDAPNATRASPDNDVNGDIVPGPVQRPNGHASDVSLLDGSAVMPRLDKPRGRKRMAEKDGFNTEAKSDANPDVVTNSEFLPDGAQGRTSAKVKLEKSTIEMPKDGPAPSVATNSTKANDNESPETDGDEEADPEEIKDALARPPPVNSDYLPLPWKGRLGYACLNTYLRQSNPPVFSSRTCRIQSILEHRHPLQDPSQPEHPTKNKPDRSKRADVKLGQRYLESVCLANVRDIEKMIKWNDKYNIKFMRLSSEMFPFASHTEYGYKLAPFASAALADAGKVIAKYGHRVTTHPGQFTQLGTPRKPVVENAIRDLEYHDEMLSLLKLPAQLNKDAVMILHMGGLFEGKAETLRRFRENYVRLPQSIKDRLVLENCDMGWSVHDLLPVCEDLNIPFVLDFHHHNIVFDASQIREGSKDLVDLFPRILATWKRKGITPKMHYSEPTPAAITQQQRRKHSPRVASLPPCPPDMDLMIEAKDKEQAVFELMRNFKLPGFERVNAMIPYTRSDDNKIALQQMSRRRKNADEPDPELIADDEVGMGGPEGRVYWPPGMEEWLRPKVNRKKEPKAKTAAQVKGEAAKNYAAREAQKRAELAAGGDEADEERESDIDATPATRKAKAAMRKKERSDRIKAAAKVEADEAKRLAKEVVVAKRGKPGQGRKVGKAAVKAADGGD